MREESEGFATGRSRPGGAATGVVAPVTRRRRPGAVVSTVLAALLSALLLGACAPAPRLDQVPDPSRSEVIDWNYGLSWHPDRRDVTYVPDGSIGCGSDAVDHVRCGGSQTLDVYPRDPTGAAARGTILYVHGGGFVSGDKSDMQGVGPMFAQRHRGWDVVSVNYRLSGSGRAQWPSAAQDVAAAVRWLRAEGPGLGLDTSRIVTFGWSAGGTLAALAGVAWNSDEPAYTSFPRVDGWVDLAGITDFDTDDRRWLGQWGATWAPAIWGAATRMSPTTFLDPDDPPGYVIHGDSDQIVSFANADRIKRVALERGASVTLDVVDRFDDGTPMTPAVRGHWAGGGVNTTSLNAFLDRI